MKLSISHIAWEASQDESMYAHMMRAGFTGLEIAPTRLFPAKPYTKCKEATVWQQRLREGYGFAVSSMQSIWYGRQESLFGTPEERETLRAYTKQTIEFAAAVACPHIVFGCPKNRNMPAGKTWGDAVPFFAEIGAAAAHHGVTIGIEANPKIYGTNFLNTTEDAIQFARMVASPGIKVNLDLGTMLENGEGAALLRAHADWIAHVHVSEPYLKPVIARALHREVAQVLRETQYDGYVSVEMGQGAGEAEICEVMRYVQSVFAG